jgi:hypothetical protein
MLFPVGASTPEMCLEFIDAARAYVHAKARTVAHEELPREDHEESTCGLLKKAMRETRDAAQNWEVECTVTRTEAVFTQKRIEKHKSGDSRR